MTFRTIFVLVLALACGGSAAFGVYRFYEIAEKKSSEAAKAPLETTPIVVAAMEIPLIGSTLNKDAIMIVDWPKGMEPAGSVKTIEEVVDKTLHVPLRKGEPILIGKFGAGRGMSSLVEHGLRAFTIHTPSSTAGVAGFVLPGDHVDVLLTRDGDEVTGGTVTTALLQNVVVLASDQMINAPQENKVRSLKSVTLSVSPDEGKRLSLAQSGGSLTLMLRNKTDLDMVASKAITWRDLEFSQGYSQGQKEFLASIGGFLGDVAASGSEAVSALKKQSIRAVARRISIPPELEEQVPQPELKNPAPLQIQTLRGNSSGLVVIQR